MCVIAVADLRGLGRLRVQVQVVTELYVSSLTHAFVDERRSITQRFTPEVVAEAV